MNLRRAFSRRFRKKTYRKAAVILVLVLCVIFICCAVRLYDLAAPIALENAKTVAQGKIETIIAESVSNVISGGNYDYSSFTLINRDKDGTVNSVFVNSVNLAKVKAEIVKEINASLSRNNAMKIDVPLGDVISPRYLSGRGFDISVNTVMYSSVKAETTSGVISAGINQTLHTISVDIEIQIFVYCRGQRNDIKVTSTQILAQSLNVGAVPDAFFDASEAAEE